MVFGNMNMLVDAVFYFAVIAYVGESMADSVRYYLNIMMNMVNLL